MTRRARTSVIEPNAHGFYVYRLSVHSNDVRWWALVISDGPYAGVWKFS